MKVTIVKALGGQRLGGEKKKREETEDEHYHCVESYSGSFQRAFQLPSGVKDQGL